MALQGEKEIFKFLQNKIVAIVNIALSGPDLRENRSERYGSASTHFAILLYEELCDSRKLAAYGRLISLLSGGAASACKALKRMLKQVPALTEPALFCAKHNGIDDLPQILAAGYFGRSADADFSAVIGSTYRVFLRRMQWTLAQAAACCGELRDVETIVAAIEKHEFDNDTAPPKRLGHDLLPTPSAVIAAVGVGVASPGADVAFPLLNPKFLNFVSAVDEALWNSHYFSIEEETVHAAFIVHMREFLFNVDKTLASAVLNFDRAPAVAPWYGICLLGVRAYATALWARLRPAQGCVGLLSRSESTTAEFTLFSLISIAVGAGQNAPDYASLYAKSNSMYTAVSGQDAPLWVLLKASLIGIRTADVDRVSERLLDLPPTLHEIVRRVIMMCVLVHTQAAMKIVAFCNNTNTLSNHACQSTIDDYPLAKYLLKSDENMQKNSIDVMLSIISGTSDLDRLASDDLAFTYPKRLTDCWELELNFRNLGIRPRVGAGRRPAPNLDDDEKDQTEIAVHFCRALKAVAIEWIRSGTPEQIRSLRRMTSATAEAHCSEWLACAFEIAVALEKHDQASGEPPLIASTTREDETYLRLNFRLQAERSLHNSRRGGLWLPGSHLVLVAWLTTGCSDNDESCGVRLFARSITEHALCRVESLVSADWRAAVERRGEDSIVECALEFERALHALISKGDVPRPVLSPSSSAAQFVNGPKRFCAGAMDDSSAAALSELRSIIADGDADDLDLVEMVATAFRHAVAIGVVALPNQTKFR